MSPSTMADNRNTSNSSLSEEKKLKERLLDEKMKQIRQKNEARLRRQREIEEDIKSANSHGEEHTSKGAVAETCKTMSGVAKDKTVSKFRGRARGRILEKMAKETLQAHQFKDRQKSNFELVEREIKDEKPSTGFLFDDRRVDMSKVGSRSTHSWGGSQFENVVDRVNTVREERPRRTPKRDQNIEINMTGKERLKYQEWKEERKRVDQSRQSRQKRGESWHREWDKCKAQKDSSSFGGRQDDQDTTHSGQRFEQRTQRKPDWDYHDDRGDDDSHNDFMPSYTKANDGNELTNVAAEEDWGDSDQSNTSVPMTTNKEDDWEESIEPTVNSKPERNSSKASHSSTGEDKETKAMDPSIINKKTDNNNTLNENKNEPQNDEDNKSVQNFTETQGHRNITDKKTKESLHGNVEENTALPTTDNNVSNSETTGQESRLGDGNVGDVGQSSKGGEQHVRKDLSENKTEGIETLRNEKEDVANEESQENEDDRPADENKDETERVTDTTAGETQVGKDERNAKDTKAKDNLPKLELIHSDEEPVPDFLKTPQHKDWADYDFDDQEIDFSQKVYYQ